MFYFIIFLAIIHKISCQQVLYEDLLISQQQAGEKVNIRKTKIDRRFLEDLDDYEWHVAHLRRAVFDGRRDCMDDTFADKVRRYRKMLKRDGARVEYVSADPIVVSQSEIVEDTCQIGHEIQEDFNLTTTKSASFLNVTNYDVNVSPTTVVSNVTKVVNTTVSMRAEETTPKVDLKATTVESNIPPVSKTKANNDTLDGVRRASEYMFSSVEYYDESIEFDEDQCPDAVQVITLQLDQIRSYDLECELTLEWRSLD